MAYALSAGHAKLALARPLLGGAAPGGSIVSHGSGTTQRVRRLLLCPDRSLRLLLSCVKGIEKQVEAGSRLRLSLRQCQKNRSLENGSPESEAQVHEACSAIDERSQPRSHQMAASESTPGDIRLWRQQDLNAPGPNYVGA